jgi:hypothetical protein
MPFLAIGIVVLVALWASKSSGSQRSLPPPTKPQPKPTTAPQQAGSIEAVLKVAAEAFTRNIYDSEAAQTFATVGFSLAISVGLAVNIGVGIIIFVIVEWIAYFIDIGAVFADASENRQDEGIANYWKRHGQIKQQFANAVFDAAAVQNKKANVEEVILCASAYADGYMEQSNLATAWLAQSNRLFHGSASMAVSGSFPHIVRAWKKGIIASTQSPVFNGVGVITPGPTMWNNFLNQKMVLSVFPPNGETFDERQPHNAATPNGKLAQQYYRIGRAHANAGMFLYELKQPVGIVEFNLFNHMNFAKPVFVGEVLWPPLVPEGSVGLNCDGFKFRVKQDASDSPHFFGAPT